MAKKNKRNIKALIAKRAELQAIGRKATVSIPGAPASAPKRPELITAEQSLPKIALPPHQTSKEIWRTLLATAFIAAVLVAVVLTDHRYSYLDTFGHTIYDALQLGS